MKSNVWIMLGLLLTVAAQGQEIHEWKVSFHVTDEASLPVKNAAATVYYDRMALPNNEVDPGKIAGLTDDNGLFTASHRDRTYGLRFSVEKNGYYPTDVTEDFHRVFSPDKLNRNLDITLKKIGNPIALYAKNAADTTFPAFNKPLGYDLMMGDWVAPDGKGANTDIIFTENHADAKSGYTFTVSFPNAGDGIQEFSVPEAEKGSELRSSHEAPLAGYKPKHEQTQMADPNRNYYFRVRTVLNRDGNVKSALYGKIYGDFMQFTYYLNPTPNDRNVEFDPKHNLLAGMKSFEQVTQP